MHHAAALALVEAEMKPAAQEVARLRNAAGDAVRHAPGNRVRRARVVGNGGLEERTDVAPSGEADAEHIRIGRREHDLIEAVAVEAVLQADLGRIGRAGKRMIGVAACP